MIEIKQIFVVKSSYHSVYTNFYYFLLTITDLEKNTHIRRIGNSVIHLHCCTSSTIKSRSVKVLNSTTIAASIPVIAVPLSAIGVYITLWVFNVLCKLKQVKGRVTVQKKYIIWHFYAIMHRKNIAQNWIISIFCSCIFFGQANINWPNLVNEQFYPCGLGEIRIQSMSALVRVVRGD